MTCRWLLFAILVAIVENAAEMAQEQPQVSDVVFVENAAEMAQEQPQVSDVVFVESSSVPYDLHETVVEPTTFAVETSLDTTTDGKETNTVDELRNRIVQQTDELNKANAALTIAEQHEQRMAMLEREKYRHVKTIENKLLCLMDNFQYTKRGLSDDTSLFQQQSTYRTFEHSGRRLQAIRRLLAGAELGLVQMQSIEKLKASNTDRR